MIPVIILCGGKGIRIREIAEDLPKALIEIGDMPILYHIMRHYIKHGFSGFVLTLGHKGFAIKQFFRDLELRYKDATFYLGMHPYDVIEREKYQISLFPDFNYSFKVTCMETGENAETLSRFKQAIDFFKHLEDIPLLEKDFPRIMLTYGDGIANIDLNALVAYHDSTKRISTITVVHPPGHFGRVLLNRQEPEDLDQPEMVLDFTEKPISNDWINGGFMVFETKRLQPYLEDVKDTDALERVLLPKLAKDGELAAYRHTGYWQHLDTPKDYQQLQQDHKDGKF